MFGKSFQHALRELVAIKLIFLFFLLIWAKCGYLVGYKKNGVRENENEKSVHGEMMHAILRFLLPTPRQEEEEGKH